MIQCRRGAVTENGDGSLSVTLRIPADHKVSFLRAWPDLTRGMNLVVAPIFGVVESELEPPLDELPETPTAAAVLRGEAEAPKPAARTIGAASAGAQGQDPMASAQGRVDGEKAIAPLLRHPPFQKFIARRDMARYDAFSGPIQRTRDYIMREMLEDTPSGKMLGERFAQMMREYQDGGGTLPGGAPKPAAVPGAEFDVKLVDQE